MNNPIRSGIYKITNSVNGKVYVGSAVSIIRRWDLHRSQLNAGKHHSVKLQRAWVKYGEASFTLDVLEYVEDCTQLLTREQHWLDTLNTVDDGYNVCRVAGSTLGVKMPESHRQRMSEVHKGRPKSEEMRRKVSEANRVRPVSQATLDAFRKARVGSTLTEEHRAKLSAATKGKPKSEQAKANMNAKRIGRVMSEETKAKIAAAQKARMTPEMRKRLSESAKNRTK